MCSIGSIRGMHTLPRHAHPAKASSALEWQPEHAGVRVCAVALALSPKPGPQA